MTRPNDWRVAAIFGGSTDEIVAFVGEPNMTEEDFLAFMEEYNEYFDGQFTTDEEMEEWLAQKAQE